MIQRNKLMTLLPAALLATTLMAQTPVVHYDMTLNEGKITEKATGNTYSVNSQLPACNVAGIDGEALRFDGYSNFVKAGLPIASLSAETLTVSMVLAAETYPMMQVDVAETTPTFATLCGNLDEAAKRGFAIQLSSQGDLRLQLYVNYGGGYLVSVDGDQKLQRGRWNVVTMTFDKAGNAVTLYLNGTAIGSKKTNRCDLLHASGPFMIGKSTDDKKWGPFLINTFCGAIDDIAVYNSLLPASSLGEVSTPDFQYPASRYESSPLGGLWRPHFHGMPSGSWTNETHGRIYRGGRYHAFFQKNANGPYMSRLHWGHISSANLYNWTEEPIAIYPDQPFDIKGCWSGCVYEDEGNTYILYTAVDNAKARIVRAKAKDSQLVEWGDKTVVIDGRPAGLSDDFRDPYFFVANGQKYIIVGTSKGGVGACTLHKWNGTSWSNDGTIFFQGGNVAQHGTFWEMPNVTPLADGNFLFTCTPLGTSVGVRVLCWVGTIGNDGKFTPLGGQEGAMQYLEMGGISRDGFGLLSPSISLLPLQESSSQGGTGEGHLLLGIVPDKLPTQTNYEIGWAHNYSLPRTFSLAADGSLVQQPYSGLTAMRTQTAYSQELTLQGAHSLSPVSGRQIELLGEFTVGTGACGFNFLKSGDKQAQLSYDPATGILTLDYTTLSRVSTDAGQWSAALPQKVNAGETLKLHVFLDGSIVDIFVNDRWAFSVRLFPTDANAVEVEAFANASTAAKINAWVLDASRDADGIRPVTGGGVGQYNPAVYNLLGRRIAQSGTCISSQRGIYIQDGRKIVR